MGTLYNFQHYLFLYVRYLKRLKHTFLCVREPNINGINKNIIIIRKFHWDGVAVCGW